LIGLTGSADALGYYTIAFSWGAMIAVTMSIVVNSVLFPTFSRIQFDRSLLYPALRYGGLVGAAAVVAVAYTMQYALYDPLYRRELAVGWRELSAAVAPAAFAAAAVAPVLFFANRVIAEHTAFALILKTLVCVLTYGLAFGSLTRWRLVADLRERNKA
jgi:Polysaccharide biosynthesis protein